MRNVLPIEPDWLCEIAPHYYQTSELKDLAEMPKGVGLALVGGEPANVSA